MSPDGHGAGRRPLPPLLLDSAAGGTFRAGVPYRGEALRESAAAASKLPLRLSDYKGWVVLSRIHALSSTLVLILLAACAGPIAAPGGGGGTVEVSDTSGMLSGAGRRVSQIAAIRGDKDYLMLDKARGRIIVFEAGKPTFSGAALTGENTADYMAPGATELTFHESNALKYKITPAGRYTVSLGFDPAYGETLDVNEIQGKDWDIAIHKVWLGAPAEHREARLRSPSTQDKHITYGCIDVEGSTMQGLVDRLPDDEHTPIYILPQDENLIIKLFQPRDAVSKIAAPAG
jgi:hypothetical protein